MRWSRERTTFFLSADPRITCVPNREGWSVRITGNSWTVAPLEVLNDLSRHPPRITSALQVVHIAIRVPSFETVKNIQTADIDYFQLRWQTLLYCLSVRLWLRHWHCHMTKQAAHRQKTRQLDGNKYRLLISDQFYLSGRCRYVKKWLTSADNDITADIYCLSLVTTTYWVFFFWHAYYIWVSEWGNELGTWWRHRFGYLSRLSPFSLAAKCFGL